MPLYATAAASARSRPLKYLLWGDGVRHLDAAASNGRRKVLCATLNEGNGSWTIKTFKARF